MRFTYTIHKISKHSKSIGYYIAKKNHEAFVSLNFSSSAKTVNEKLSPNNPPILWASFVTNWANFLNSVHFFRVHVCNELLLFS